MLAKLSPERKMLLDAAQILREQGWCQNKLNDEKGHRCAIDAMVIASPPDGETWMRAVKLVKARLGTLSGLVQWNDAYERTADEVINLFESVALSDE